MLTIYLYYLGLRKTKWDPPAKYCEATKFTAKYASKQSVHPPRDGTEAISPASTIPSSAPTPSPPPIAMTRKESKEDLEKALKDPTLCPPDIPIKETIGKLHLMKPTLPYAQDHPAIPLLQAYAEDGCPVDCGPDWTINNVN